MLEPAGVGLTRGVEGLQCGAAFAVQLAELIEQLRVPGLEARCVAIKLSQTMLQQRVLFGQPPIELTIGVVGLRRAHDVQESIQWQ